MREYIKNNWKFEVLLIVAAVVYGISNTLFLPYVINAITGYSIISAGEYVWGIGLTVLSIILFAAACIIRSRTQSKLQFVLKIILVILIYVVITACYSALVGGLATIILKVSSDLIKAKMIIDVISEFVYIPLISIGLCLLANLITKDKIFDGIKFKKYIKVLLIYIVFVVQQYIFNALGGNIMWLRMFLSIVNGLLIAAALFIITYIWDRE